MRGVLMRNSVLTWNKFFSFILPVAVALTVSCAHKPSDGHVQRLTDNGEFVIYLSSTHSEPGDAVKFYKEVCQNPSGKGMNRYGCQSIQVGEGQIIGKQSEHEYLVRANTQISDRRGLTAKVTNSGEDASHISGVTK